MAGYADYTSRYKFAPVAYETDPARIADTTTLTGALKGLFGAAAGVAGNVTSPVVAGAGNLGLKMISDGYGYSQTPIQQQQAFEGKVAADMRSNLGVVSVTPSGAATPPGKIAIAPAPSIIRPAAAAQPPAARPAALLPSHTTGAVVKIDPVKAAETVASTSTPPATGGTASVKSITPPRQGYLKLTGVPGATATIDAEGQIARTPGWTSATGGGGSVTYMPAFDERAASDYNPDGTPKNGPVPADVAVRRALGFLPSGYYSNPGRYEDLIAASAVNLSGQGALLSGQAAKQEAESNVGYKSAQANKLVEEAKVVGPLAEGQQGYWDMLGQAGVTNAEAAALNAESEAALVPARKLYFSRYGADGINDSKADLQTQKEAAKIYTDNLVYGEEAAKKAYSDYLSLVKGGEASKTVIARSKDGKYVKYSDGTTAQVKK